MKATPEMLNKELGALSQTNNPRRDYMKKLTECDLCQTEKSDCEKDDGIWVCKACDVKYPKIEEEEDNF